MYNLSVARELLKQVYVAERLQPPTDFAAVRSAYSTLWSRASSQAYWRGILSSGEWAKVAIYAVEAYGIFKVCLILVYDVTVVNY
jgi:F-type H+-transporting ATPase subunit g